MFSIHHIIHYYIFLCAKTFKPWTYLLFIIFTRANLAKQYIQFDSQLNLVKKIKIFFHLVQSKPAHVASVKSFNINFANILIFRSFLIYSLIISSISIFFKLFFFTVHFPNMPHYILLSTFNTSAILFFHSVLIFMFVFLFPTDLVNINLPFPFWNKPIRSNKSQFSV
jgi:hypothetical protein